MKARLFSFQWSTLPVGETVTAVGSRRTMQCIAFGVHEEYARAWGEDAKQDMFYARKRFGTGGAY